MQMTLTAVGRLQCGRAQTCYIGGFILFFLFFFRVSNIRIPASANGPRRSSLHFVTCSLCFGFFCRGGRWTARNNAYQTALFHSVEIILVSFAIHAAINGFYFCVTPNSHLL